MLEKVCARPHIARGPTEEEPVSAAGTERASNPGWTRTFIEFSPHEGLRGPSGNLAASHDRLRNVIERIATC